MDVTFRQDMPPEGGYKPLQWERIPIKSIFGFKLTIGVIGICSTIGSIGYYFSYKKFKKEELEMNSARNAITPMLVAERDRAFLKQIRKNRDEERELMKNVPNWEVGTYFGEPIYRTLGKDKYFEPEINEFYAHSNYFDAVYRTYRRYLT